MATKYPARIQIATLFTCAFTCLAYEAIKINGWYNRFGEDRSLGEVASSQWHPFALLIYLSLFLPYFVVSSNDNKPKIAVGWFLLSASTLVLACANIPGAMLGRWGSTADVFVLLYCLVVPLPAIIFILVGLNTKSKIAGRDSSQGS